LKAQRSSRGPRQIRIEPTPDLNEEYRPTVNDPVTKS